MADNLLYVLNCLHYYKKIKIKWQQFTGTVDGTRDGNHKEFKYYSSNSFSTFKVEMFRKIYTLLYFDNIY